MGARGLDNLGAPAPDERARSTMRSLRLFLPIAVMTGHTDFVPVVPAIVGGYPPTMAVIVMVVIIAPMTDNYHCGGRSRRRH